MDRVALLCNGSTQPNKTFDVEVVVRVNKGIPRHERRTDIWFFGDGFNYSPYQEHFKTARKIGYSNCVDGGWFERYPTRMFNDLKTMLLGYQPSIGLMALYWLMQEYDDILIYGMDFFNTGYFYDKQYKGSKITNLHDFYKEEKLVEQFMNERKGIKMAVKGTKNKAVQGKVIKKVTKSKIVKCPTCGIKVEYNGVTRGCPDCNTLING